MTQNANRTPFRLRQCALRPSSAILPNIKARQQHQTSPSTTIDQKETPTKPIRNEHRRINVTHNSSEINTLQQNMFRSAFQHHERQSRRRTYLRVLEFSVSSRWLFLFWHVSTFWRPLPGGDWSPLLRLHFRTCTCAICLGSVSF